MHSAHRFFIHTFPLKRKCCNWFERLRQLECVCRCTNNRILPRSLQKIQHKTSQRRVSQFAVLTSRNTRPHFVCRSAAQERARFDPESEEGDVFCHERHTSLLSVEVPQMDVLLYTGFKMLKWLLASHLNAYFT